MLSNIVWGSGVNQELAVNGKTLTETFDGKTAAQVAEDLKGIADARAFAKKIAPFLSSHTDSTGKTTRATTRSRVLLPVTISSRIRTTP